MQIENLNIAARPRTGWQALDLGILMAQRWYLPLLACFAVPLGVIALGCVVLLPDSPSLALVLIWWFKPLYERVPLSFLSTAIFGEVPSVREALKRWRQCVLPGLLPALTYLRLSPTRSFKAPVLVLEGLTGTAQKQRCEVLNASLDNEATWLTVICVHVEGFLNLGMVVFFAMLIPTDILEDVWDAYVQGLGLYEAWANNLLSVIAFLLVGPFYVAAGFALYINRRVELEAWDIELGFRKIARRLSGSAAALVLICCAQLTVLPPAHAEESDDAEVSKAAITEILETPPYHHNETFKYPAFLDSWDWGIENDSSGKTSLNLTWLAVLIEISLWALGIAAILWLVRRLQLLDRLITIPQKTEPKPPEKLFGMAVDKATLPADVLQSAEDCWRSGDQRAALSLLLRGWLVQMIQHYGCRFREGDTEADCLRVVKEQTRQDTHSRFARLIGSWQRVAYAHQTPSDEDFLQLRSDWTSQWADASD